MLGISEDRLARDMGRVPLACEEHAEQAVREAQTSDPEIELSEAERERALSLLRDPALIERIGADFARIGVVGEESNCLIGYLAAVSRKLDRPLAVIVQSTSAAGKSALQEAVLAMVLEEERYLPSGDASVGFRSPYIPNSTPGGVGRAGDGSA